MKFTIIVTFLILFATTFAQVDKFITTEQAAQIATAAAELTSGKRGIEQSGPLCEFSPKYPLDNFNYTECQDFSELLVFITGISTEKGNGRAIAVDLAQRGATVAGCGRTNFNNVANNSVLTNLGITYYRCEVASQLSMNAVAKKVKHDFNGKKVDILVSNAGIHYWGRNAEAYGRSVSFYPKNDGIDSIAYSYAVNSFGLHHTFMAFNNEGLIAYDGTAKVFATTSIIAEYSFGWSNLYQDTKKAIAGAVQAFQIDFGIPNNVSFIGIQPTAMDTNIFENSFWSANPLCPGNQQDVLDIISGGPGLGVSDPATVGETVAQLSCHATPNDVQRVVVDGTPGNAQYNNYVNLRTIWCSLPQAGSGAPFWQRCNSAAPALPPGR